jgi:hypothetical protein
MGAFGRGVFGWCGWSGAIVEARGREMMQMFILLDSRMA